MKCVLMFDSTVKITTSISESFEKQCLERDYSYLEVDGVDNKLLDLALGLSTPSTSMIMTAMQCYALDQGAFTDRF